MNMRAVRKGDPTVAVAYLRVSTDDQALGLEAQRAAIDAWAKARAVTVVEWCIDQGVSGGAALEARPELARALVRLSELQAGVLIVAKRDRLARDVIVAALVEKLAANGGAVVLSAAGEGSDTTDDPSSQLLRRMVDAFAEYERAMIAMRTRNALAAKRKRGEIIGGVPPWGYRLSEDRHSWVVDEREQQMLALVRELRAQGKGVRPIARALDAAGFRTRNGRAVVHSSVVKMLQAMERARAAA
jgi:DNA invertase Pin-like site-specific DNA recombinase